MADAEILNKTFHFIMMEMKETGVAPHYTDIARALGVSVEEGRKTLHELFNSGIPGWLYPETDLIVSFAPFNNLPTQYKITVDGEQKWFGQWAFESLAVSWLYPGKTVEIDAPCLDCGEPIHVEMKDGKLVGSEPEGIVGHVSVPFPEWMAKMAYSWSTMHFFRSEEHLNNWTEFDPATRDGMVPLNDLVTLFSIEFFQKRLEPDYLSGLSEYIVGFFPALVQIGKTGAFWMPGAGD
jgi:hypothetical protein